MRSGTFHHKMSSGMMKFRIGYGYDVHALGEGLPLILGGVYVGGCAIPGVIATRAIPDERARMATILIVPMMNCLAKVPLYLLLVGAFFSSHAGWAMFFIGTVTLLMGFMLGSLNKVWPWKEVTEMYVDSHGELQPLVERNVLPGRFEALTQLDAQVAEAVVLCIVGFLLIYAIELAGRIIMKRQGKEE